jgi:TRAP-type C4-dicarboxylate transport system substrate-binding protein
MRLVGLRAVVAGLALLSAVSASAQTVWRMPTEYPASAIAGEGIADFAKRVGERSGGRLVVEPSYDASAGFKSGAMLPAVAEGKVEAGDAFTGALGTADPIFAVSSLPFLVSSIEQAKRLADLARPAYEKALAAKGQRLLYTTPWPPSGIWSKRPIGSVADLRALSIRTYDATSTAVLKGAGANAVNLSFADAMPKLKEGAVDAVLSSGDGGAGRRLWEFLPHFTEVTYALPLSVATVNAKAYEALPDELRKAVDAAAAETEARQWTVIRTRLEENYATMRTNGVVIESRVPPEVKDALARAGETVVRDWLAKVGPEGEDMLARLRTP